MTEVEAYHEMYLTMARAAEQAIRLLVEAQQTCETLYVEGTEQEPAKASEPPAPEEAPGEGKPEGEGE